MSATTTGPEAVAKAMPEAEADPCPEVVETCQDVLVAWEACRANVHELRWQLCQAQEELRRRLGAAQEAEIEARRRVEAMFADRGGKAVSIDRRTYGPVYSNGGTRPGYPRTMIEVAITEFDPAHEVPAFARARRDEAEGDGSTETDVDRGT